MRGHTRVEGSVRTSRSMSVEADERRPDGDHATLTEGARAPRVVTSTRSAAYRGHGEGSIYRRKDGRWEAALQVDGRRRRWAGRTRAEVARKLAAAQHDIENGLAPVSGRTTVGDFLDRWLDTVSPRLRPLTLLRYRQLVRHQLTPHLGRVPLARLTPAHVATMLARVQAGGASARTAGHARACLRAALADGLRWGLVARNAAQLCSAPRVPAPSPRILSPAEVEAVLAALADPSVRRLATVAVHTGLRQGELLGLQWRDLDLAAGECRVRHALQRIAGAYTLVEPKSLTSRRPAPLTVAAVQALMEERDAQARAREVVASAWDAPIPDLVFTTAIGTPRNGPALTHTFEGAIARAGLPRLRWHHLRHAYAGLLLAAGSDLATVSALLGHSSVALTASTYAGVAPSLRRAAVDRLGRLLAPEAREMAADDLPSICRQAGPPGTVQRQQLNSKSPPPS